MSEGNKLILSSVNSTVIKLRKNLFHGLSVLKNIDPITYQKAFRFTASLQLLGVISLFYFRATEEKVFNMLNQLCDISNLHDHFCCRVSHSHYQLPVE